MSEGGARGPSVPVPPKPQAVSPARGGMTPSPPRVAPPLLPLGAAAVPAASQLVGVKPDPAKNPFLAQPTPPPPPAAPVPPALPSQAATPKAPPVQPATPPPPMAAAAPAPVVPPPDAAVPPSMIPVAFASEAPRELPVVAAARRADELRAEVRAALGDVLEDALAPIHKTLRDLERRIEEAEKRAPSSVAPAMRADAQSVAMRARHDPFASVPAPAMRAQQPSLAPSYAASPARAPSASLDFDVPFDGARRRKKLATTFAVLLVLVFGALFAALAFSYNRGGG